MDKGRIWPLIPQKMNKGGYATWAAFQWKYLLPRGQGKAAMIPSVRTFPPSRNVELLERALGWKEAVLREFHIEESSLREGFPRLARVQLLE